MSESTINVLNVFYSRGGENKHEGTPTVVEVGNTKVVAEEISHQLEQSGAAVTTVELTPSEPYPFSYDEVVERHLREESEDARPAYTNEPIDISAYDAVLIGCPMWTGREPLVVDTFLEAHSFSDTAVFPYCTSGGGGTAMIPDNIAHHTPGAILGEALSVASWQLDQAPEKITQWLTETGLVEA